MMIAVHDFKYELVFQQVIVYIGTVLQSLLPQRSHGQLRLND